MSYQNSLNQGCLRLAQDSSTGYPPLAACDERDRINVQFMLFFQDTRRERLDRVVVRNRHGPLQYDWAGVQMLVNEMNRAAGPPDAMLKRLSLRVQTRKGRKQARMNIYHAPAKRLYKFG
jgi:hypothetical protein